MFNAWLQRLHEGAAWYKIPQAKRTSWQRLAACTQGLATPGNAATVIGAILALTGLGLFYGGHLGIGSLLVVAGRFGDVLDGYLARKTKTQSPFGEGLDAAFDKVIILVASLVFIANSVMPLLIVLFLVAEQVATATLTLLARRKGIPLHPTRLGKLATFGVWMVVSAYFVVYDIQHGAQLGSWHMASLASSHAGRVLYDITTVCAVFAIIASMLSLGRYIAMARRQSQAKQKGL